MKKSITFLASLHRVVMDNEGESRVTFTIPKNDLDSVMLLAKQNGKFLGIGVVVYENDPRGPDQKEKSVDDMKRKINL